MFHLIGQLIVGLIVGVIARLLVPGREPIAAGALGWLITALIGMGGSLLGTVIGRAIWRDQGYKAGWILSILGAVLLLIVVRYLF
jgi:uncharacterized membrane protein YeaQ/YmgE (transglycosylase-associated protein family)